MRKEDFKGVVELQDAKWSEVIVDITKIDSGATLPEYQFEEDAGLDLYANDNKKICSGARTSIATGIKIKLPQGYVGFITPRSGLAYKKGITVINAPGTLDAGYTGEIKVLLINHGSINYKIKKGDRIAQLVILPIMKVRWNQVDSLKHTERSINGIGSTGR